MLRQISVVTSRWQGERRQSEPHNVRAGANPLLLVFEFVCAGMNAGGLCVQLNSIEYYRCVL